MLRVNILTSGSRDGNCAILNNGDTTIMIDVGHMTGGWSKVEAQLEDAKYDIKDIDALLITHRHQDHVNQLNNFIKNTSNDIIYTTKMVAVDIESVVKKNNKHKRDNKQPKFVKTYSRFDMDEINLIKLGAKNVIGSFEVTPRKLIHAGIKKSKIKECIGFEIYDTKNDKWILFATDTSSLDMFRDSGHEWDLMLVESNYDKSRLEFNYFDVEVTPRTFSTYTRTIHDHMSSEHLFDFILDEGIDCPIIELHESIDNKTKLFDKSKYKQTFFKGEK